MKSKFTKSLISMANLSACLLFSGQASAVFVHECNGSRNGICQTYASAAPALDKKVYYAAKNGIASHAINWQWLAFYVMGQRRGSNDYIIYTNKISNGGTISGQISGLLTSKAERIYLKCEGGDATVLGRRNHQWACKWSNAPVSY